MRKKRLYRDKNWLYRKYIIERFSTPEIGKICRVGYTQIRYWLIKYRIKIRNISESKKGIPFTEEHKKKLSEAHVGKHCSKELKEKISKANKGNKYNLGHKHTEKTKMKMRGSRPGFTGKNHPQWQGGISFEPYGIEFNKKLKEEIRKRDNYTCQMLDCNAIQNGKKFPIHHSDYDKRNNEDWNLVTLCHPCHSKTNSNREYWENYFKVGGLQ